MKRIMKYVVIAVALLTQSAMSESFNSQVINVSGTESGNIVLVEKADQTLMVMKSFGPQQLSTVKSFKVTTGRNRGDKAAEGDLRTPEGIYYVKYEIPGEKLAPKYGPLAMVLDYPNALDQLNHHNGTNIWIHGRDVEIKDLQTEGCISLENENTLQLETFITREKTPIIIVDSLKYFSANDMDKERRLWNSKLELWRKYWETGDMERYFQMYSKHFVDQSGRSMQEFARYKSELDKRYAWKKISIRDIMAYRTDSEVHVHFMQTYDSPVFSGTGYKILVFVLDGEGEWRILRETYNDTQPRHYVEADLKYFLRQWKMAWESKDIKRYEKFYSPNFNSGDMNFIQYLDYKTQKFSETSAIHLSMSDISIVNKSPDIWQIRFLQDYSAGDYHDTGWKTLTIKDVNKVYFIIDETWQNL